MKIILGLAVILIGFGAGFATSTLINNRQATENKAIEQEAKVAETGVSEDAKSLQSLRNKKGKDFDKEYLSLLMTNSQKAIDIANLAEGRTEREEIKKWSKFLIETEPSSINTLKTLYGQWGFRAEDLKNDPHEH